MDDLARVLNSYAERVRTMPTVRVSGVVRDVVGSLVESAGPAVRLGDICEVDLGASRSVRTQVVGFRNDHVLTMPLDEVDGLRPGLPIRSARRRRPKRRSGRNCWAALSTVWADRSTTAGPLLSDAKRPLYADPPGPMEREAIRTPAGDPACESWTVCCRAVSASESVCSADRGVGKSTLLAALARHSSADVNVIALVGERNREVRAFVEDNLGSEGLARSVVVAATSDRPAPVRVRAGFLATTVAEYFRDQGRDVLLVMDSVTRLAMAQREIGLAAGEPPSQKGYTPSVFQLLPRLFERAGNFKTARSPGCIPCLLRVTISMSRSPTPAAAILDGHIVLSRELASAGHYPPIDVLESVSRLAPDISTPEQIAGAARLRESHGGLSQHRRPDQSRRLHSGIELGSGRRDHEPR